MRARSAIFPLLILAAAFPGFHTFRQNQPANPRVKLSPNYLGFDRNLYPGDAALPVLRKTFAFAGYWLSPPPGEKQNTWHGKRSLLRDLGFGFLLLYLGRESRELKSDDIAHRLGSHDALDATLAAKQEGFPAKAIIFLDIEEGGRLSPSYHSYLRAWVDAVTRAGYRPGVYCSGIPVDEGNGVTVTTAGNIRENLGSRELHFWIFADQCPPSPGCATRQSPLPPSASGIPYANVWQFAQSPRRTERTARCTGTYDSDGNCYAPGDTARAWHFDLDTASSPDPSAGAN